MTSEEYLNQARRLDLYITNAQAELEGLMELSCSASSVGFEEHSGQRRVGDAKFVSQLYNIEDRKNELKWQIEKYKKLKAEINKAISEMKNEDERIILIEHYLKRKGWCCIARMLYVSEGTVRNWHKRALDNFAIPDNPTIL